MPDYILQLLLSALLLAGVREGEQINLNLGITSPPNVAAIACHDKFSEMMGGVHPACRDRQGMVLYWPSFRQDDKFLAHIIIHERYHLDNTTLGPPSDIFREHEAHNHACREIYVPQCKLWAPTVSP